MFVEVLVAVVIVVLAAVLCRPAARRALRRSWRAFIGADAEGVTISAADARVVEVAVRAVRERAARGQRPNLVEVGVSPRGYRVVRDRVDVLDVELARQLAVEGLPVEVRLCLREVPQLRRSAPMVMATDAGARTRRFDDAESEAPTAMPRMRLRQGGAEHRLADPTTTVGRAVSNDIVFASRHLSAQHATIRRERGLRMVVDHSSNGTWVDGRRLETGRPYPLPPGASVRFADVECVFEGDVP